MKVVVTRVKLKPGLADACAKLFMETNPALVCEEPDWVGARMVVDRENDVVSVMATWRNRTSYDALANSERFKTTMASFAQLFASPPEITVNDVLVDMTPESISAG